MCGFFGYLATRPPDEGVLQRGLTALRHRGPDDHGMWTDGQSGVGLGHVRLSILELSAAGRQPMHSAAGRYVLAFNGEIYNHLQLRRELERADAAPQWRGRSDTETLLAGFDEWGVEATIRRVVGMFAFAVWDRQQHQLVLARDRVGEKPLYYGWCGDILLFGSELKAFAALQGYEQRVDRGALALLMRHGYVPAPFTIFENVRKQLPGTLLTFSLEEQQPRAVRYWDPATVVAAARERPFEGSPSDAVDVLDDLLRSAVSGQMVSDVPLGAFLSGGVDSSAIVAVMQELSSRPVQTFTIGFHEPAYNEADSAAAVARHLGTDHTELYVTPREAMDVIPSLPGLYCEPFADASQIPTSLVSALARRHVTVSLSGDAGDELFGGYNRYVVTQRVWRHLSRVPVALRAALARALCAVPAGVWDGALSPVQALLPAGLVQRNVGDKLLKSAGVLAARNPLELYRLLVSQWPDTSLVVRDAAEPATLLVNANGYMREGQEVHGMMALDLLTYLPDDILVKVDRAAMGVSLESRVPLLDHRIVEFAWQLPIEYKLRDGLGKWPLRQVLYRRVPRSLIERPKMGFGVPIDAWLRGPLRDWAEDLLAEDRLRQDGYFEPEVIRRIWAEHLSGRRNWQYRLWAVLMFQAWVRARN